MERRTVVKHFYITGLNLQVMKILGLMLLLGGIIAVAAAFRSPVYLAYGIWGWLGILTG